MARVIETGQKLRAAEVPFAIWTEPLDAATGRHVPGQGVHRFYRFGQPVRLDRLEIPVRNPGPRGGGPRDVVVFVYGQDLARPQVIFDGERAADEDSQVWAIPLSGVPAEAASVWCDRRYPVDVSFECLHPTTTTLPFDLIQNVRWFGRPADGPRRQPPYQPPLRLGRVEPRPAPNQQVSADPYEVRFTSAYLAVGFSLRRPQLTFLGWDALGQAPITNFLFRVSPQYVKKLDKVTVGNGPCLSALHYDATPFLWTGAVEVEGNVVRYSNLHVQPGWTIGAEFEVGERGIILRLRQTVERETPALDAAAWGFTWDGKRVPSLATNAMPIRGRRRNGGVEPRGAWEASGLGALNFSTADALDIQVANTGFSGRLSLSGLQLGARHEPAGTITLLPGEYEAILHLDVRTTDPAIRPGARPLHDGIRRCWGSAFAFRPEGGGFSNNGYSINCQNCLYFQADLAPYTVCRDDGPDMIELVRYTAGLAVQGGPGYACQWDQALDAAPSLAISIAQVHRTRPDRAWLEELWPYLRRPFDHILNHIDETGMYVSRVRTGNSGLGERSANAWDTICFGHYDAYSGALAYRALRCGAAVARDANDMELSRRCRDAAEALRRAYQPTLLDPTSGLIAGWRSADGQWHEHAYVYVNSMAICFGLVGDRLAREILTALEQMRLELGIDDFRYGIPTNLKPIPRADCTADLSTTPERDDGLDKFGMFLHGSLMPTGGFFYLRALSAHGFAKTADQICEQLLDSFAQRRFEGGLHSGTEYFTLDGTPTGYEGTLTHGYHVLLAIALHRGYVEMLQPDWWPA